MSCVYKCTERILLSVLLVFGRLVVDAQAQAQVQPGNTTPLILNKEEGDRLGNQLIKADPENGSYRFGVGLQRLTRDRGISMHMHEQEDEVLFIHSGSGEGVAGANKKSIQAGTTMFIPQGTWHGINVESDIMEVFWVACPPHFAEHLREISSSISKNKKIKPGEIRRIQTKHGFRDSADFFIPRVLVIASILAVGGALVTTINHRHYVKNLALYAIASCLGSAATLLTIGVGYIPLLTIAIVIMGFVVAAYIGAFTAIGVRWLAVYLLEKSND